MPVNILYCEGISKGPDVQVLGVILPPSCVVRPVGSKQGLAQRILGAKEIKIVTIPETLRVTRYYLLKGVTHFEIVIMAQQSLKVKPELLETVKLALRSSGARQADLALELALSRTVVSKFFNGYPVSSSSFQEICQKLRLSWKEIADLSNADYVNEINLGLRFGIDFQGDLENSLGHYQQAIEFQQQSLNVAREIGDRNGEGSALGNLGIAYQSLGQYQQAIEFHQQVLNIAREIGDRNGEGSALGNLGIAYQSLGQYQQAIEFHQQVLNIAREIGDRNGEGSALGNLGIAYQSLGQYQQAIEFHQQWLNIAREIGDRNGEGSALGNLGIAYQSLGQYQQAIEFHQQWLNIAREIGDRNGERSALGNLGIAYQSLGQYQQAIEFHQQVLNIAREIGDRNGEGSALGNLGIAYQSLGQYQQAIEFHQQWLNIAREIGDHNGEGSALGNLGIAYQSLGQYQQAIEFHQQWLNIAREIGDRNGEGSALGNLGIAYQSLGQYQQAIEFHQQVLIIAREIGDHFSEGRAFGNLGIAYQSLGQYQHAIEYHQQVLSIAREIGDHFSEGRAFGNLGIAYQSLGQYQHAIEYHQQVLSIAREIGDHFSEGRAFGKLGIAYQSLGQYQKAIHFHQQSLNVAREIGDRFGEGSALGGIGLAYQSLGQYQQAIEFQQQWLNIAREIGDHFSEGRAFGNLGIAYQSLGQYQQAIECLQRSLVISREIGDRNGEMISLSNLGRVYCQATQGDRAENIESAIAVYCSVLEVCDRESFPEQWAKTQNNLGLAFSERIRGDKAENLNAAITYHQAALEVYTREAFPYQWADTCKNIGNAYTETTHDNSLNNIDCLHNIEYAILFYQDALEIYTPDQFPDECLIIREKLSNAHYLLEYYQRELEFASFYHSSTRDEALARIEIVRANILDLEVDAIIIPTSSFFNISGQLGKQLFTRLGSTLSEQLQSQTRPLLGEVIVIDGSSLPASYLFITPVHDQNNITEINIFKGVTATLTKANSLSNVRTIAFPSVGTGALGFNPAILAPKILKIVTNHLNKENHLEKVIFAFIDETAYQAYASAYQMLLLETGVAYNVSVTIPEETVSLGEEIEISVNLNQLNQAEITQRETYTIQISHNDAIGCELNIILTAPGFQFNNDNITSLPLDPDTANITQSVTFNLTALRSGTTKIKVELYCGEIYKTTLESEVEVTALEETEVRPLIAARSRPVPQPDLILQIRTNWNPDTSTCTFNYHIDSYQPRLLFTDDVDYISQSLSATWVERYSEGVTSRSHSLLKTTLEEAASSLPGDFHSRLVSLGQYLFQSLLPEELQNTFRTIASLNHPFTLLILADQDAWFPWELLHDGQKFLGDRLIIGRWLWELEKARPYEFPVGAVNVAHYASVEQPELWTELLHSSGAPPPIPMQAGVFNDMTLFESIRGLHLIRYGQYVDTTNRQDAPVQVNSSSNIEDIEREVQPAKLSLRRNHPLVSLSYLNAGQTELTALEQTWASTFVRAGCSAFVGSLWAVQPNVEAAFVSAFYHSIWAGQTLGMAFQTARRLTKTVVPESLDWLAYVLFGDPMARPYRPVQGQGYAVVEPIGQEIDDPVSPGSTVRFRVSLRRTPPVWYENRLMEVAEDLTFDDLRIFIVTSGLQVTPDDSIVMTRTATGDYLGWFTLTVPAEMETQSVLVQVYFEDGMEPVHNLRFALNIVKRDGEAQ